MARKSQIAESNARTNNGSLPTGWRMARFDEIGQMVNERVNPSDSDADIYVGLEHLDSDTLKIRRWGIPSDVIGDKLQFRKGDIIFGRRRAYQRKLAVADFDGICSAHAMVVRAKTDNVDPSFLPFLMQSDMFMQRAIDISVGSLSPTINWKTLRIQEFPLPPKDDQRRIAEILWAADELRMHLEESTIRADVAIRVYRDFITSSSKPSQMISLESVCDVVTKGESPGWQGFDYVQSGPLFVTSENVGDGIFLPTPQKHIPGEFHKKLARSALTKDDVLINLVGASIGRACIFPLDATQANVNQAVAVVRVDSQKIMPKYLLTCVLSRHGLTQIFGSRVDSARPNVSLTNIRELRIPLLPVSEQKHVVAQMDALEDARDRIGNHLVTVVQMTRTLRNQMIHGAAHDLH